MIPNTSVLDGLNYLSNKLDDTRQQIRCHAKKGSIILFKLKGKKHI